MKHIHHLKTSWLFLAMLAAVAVGEALAWYVSRSFEVRLPVVAVAAVCVGLVAGGVSLLYDGRD